MKNEKDFNAEILKTIEKIKKTNPELMKYLDEMPIKISGTTELGTNTKNLKEYHDSLIQLLKKYELEHPNTINKF